MDLRVLRTFVAVAELKHFARAASLCNLSQPAVSHQIALLEDDVGARLLNRANRRVSLTVAGEVMLEEARRILSAVDRARDRMQDVVQGAVGRVRLGATPTPGLYVLPPLLAAYRDANPTYDLQLEIGPVHQIAERVARNELDMAILSSPPPTAELRSRPLVVDPMVVIAAPTHPLAKSRSVKPAQLDAERWIVREDASETMRTLVTWWRRHHLQPAKRMVFDGPEAVKRAVMAHLGIAMVSRVTVQDELKSGALAVLRIQGALPSRSVVIVDHPQKHHGAACRAMLGMFDRSFSAAGDMKHHAARPAVRVTAPEQ